MTSPHARQLEQFALYCARCQTLTPVRLTPQQDQDGYEATATCHGDTHTATIPHSEWGFRSPLDARKFLHAIFPFLDALPPLPTRPTEDPCES